MGSTNRLAEGTFGPVDLRNPTIEPILLLAVQRLRDALTPTAIYLYGSYGYGTPQSHSDLDLLVVVPESVLSTFQRDALAYRALGDIPFPIDVQVYTQAEFDERSALTVSFERTVRLKGKLVHAA